MVFDLIYVYENKNKSLPDYAYDSIKSLRNKENINLHLIVSHPEIVIEELQNKEDFNRIIITKLEKYKKVNVIFNPDFRDNFFGKTISRFFVLENYIKKNNLTKVFHCECDIYFQVSLEIIYNEIKEPNKIYSCRDAPNRVISSIIYFPNHTEIKKMTDFFIRVLQQNKELNDMQLLSLYPHINSLNTSPNENKDIIFDPACFGQNLLGIDPRNTNKHSTVGFINETSTFKPKLCKFHKKNGLWYYNNSLLGILHIHSKNFSSLF